VSAGGLERRYRRLLWAYPGAYRRRHGLEIVTTLLDMAEAGHRRPGLVQALHLVLCGLRQRFRLPARRPFALAAAVLAALILAAFGAAAGSWLASATFSDIPGDQGVRALVAGTGMDVSAAIERNTAPWWGETASTAGPVHQGWTADEAIAALRAAGWDVTGVQRMNRHLLGLDENAAPGAGFEHLTPISAIVLTNFDATRDGLTMRVSGTSGVMGSGFNLEVTPAGNDSLLPLIVLGTVAGGIAGWLLAAAAAYRTRRAPAGRRIAATAGWALTVLVLALPAVTLAGNTIKAVQHAGDRGPVFTVHSAFTPGHIYDRFGPPWLLLALSVAGLLIALITAASVVRPTPASPEPVARTS
jgi:hypothetical protein